MKIFLPKSTIFAVLFLLFAQAVAYSQTLGDYRSNSTNGNWTTLSSWQYYNGTSWVTPSGTSPQGYPGQFAGTGTVTILNGNSITLNIDITNSFVELIIGESATATSTSFANFSVGGDFKLTTLDVVISKYAVLQFTDNKGTLYLPLDAGILIEPFGGLATQGGPGNCNNNVNIFIGTTQFGVCTGGGALFTFEQLNTSGGTLYAKPTSNSPICPSGTIQLTGNAISPNSAVTVSYSWDIVTPSGPNITSLLQNLNISNALVGTYKATLKCSAVYNGINYSNSETIDIIVANPIAPTVSTVQPNCSTNTGQITITSPTGSGIKYSIDGSDYTNTSGIFTSLSGTYSVTAKNSSGCISPSVSVTIAQPTKTWNGSWIPTGSPTFDDFVIINSNYSGNIEACSLTINNGATLTIPDGNFVTIKNDLTVNLGGILDIANKGSLVMINDSGVVTNNGTIKVNKTTTAYEKFDYTYWSSPFQSISIPAIFSGWRTDYAFDFHPENFIDSNADGFDDDQNDWANISSMSNPGKGFIVRMPDAGPFTGTSVVFTGNALNNGVVSPSILLTTDSDNANDWNLVGNPYPSAISADSFITQNSASISGTLYFWTHKQDISISNPGPGMYNYTQDDYAMYNLSGGVGTGTGNIEGGVAQVDTKPLGYIASGQGFFVEANVAGNLKFNNSMRSGATITNANTQFYKVATSKEKSTVKNRLWLNMENTEGMFSQQLVGYFAAATNAYDSGYDGLVSDAGNYISFYSFINEDIYKIQGRAAFNKEDQVRLGYFSSVSGTFNINIDSKEGVFNTDETPVYLEDKLLHIIHDLKKGAYSFSTQIGSFDDRFVLRYTNKETEISDKSENSITVYKDKNELVIDSKLQNISRVTVFDLYGKKLFDKELSNSKELHISNGILKNQVLVLNIKLANGQLVSKKVI
jgi:hypothetical protein